MNLENLKSYLVKSEKAVVYSLSIYLDAHTFVRTHFKKYLLISGMAFLLLFTVSIKAIIYGVNYIENPITQWLLPFLQKFITLGKFELEKGIQFVFWLLKQTIESNKYVIFSTLFLIIGTPFFSFISSKTEEIMHGKIYPFNLGKFFKEMKRGVSISFLNSIKQLILILLITLLALFPLVDVVAPLLIFIVQVYYNGILMTDYTLERHDFSVKASEHYYKTHKPEMFGIGLGFMFLLILPVVGWFLAPTYGLVASYLFFDKTEKLVNE